jgi:hypothetical protein
MIYKQSFIKINFYLKKKKIQFVGIIIDTFKSLKEEMENRKTDEEMICFICGYDRETIDKTSGFLRHIKVFLQKKLFVIFLNCFEILFFIF